MGPKEAAPRDALDVAFGPLDGGSGPQAVQAADVSLQEAAPMEKEQDKTVLPREARGTTPVADFARLTVSMGTPEGQRVSTLPVMPSVREQIAPQDIEMTALERDTIILREEAAGTSGVPSVEGVP